MIDLIEVEKHVCQLYNEQLPATFIYHNLNHTKKVVKKTLELIEEEKVHGQDKENLIVASWFHDLGHINGCKSHEGKSAELAITYLEKLNIETKQIEEITKLILVTSISSTPQTILEKIICDADTAHVASKNYSKSNTLLRGEWELIGSKVYSDENWLEENIIFLTEEHKFHTNFAQNNWQKGKNNNILSLIQAKKEIVKANKKDQLKQSELLLKKEKANRPERGIETMFRVTLKNHITLSDIADTKANILLSVNAIIVSLVLSNMIPKLDNPTNHHLIIPTVIFVLFTVVSMILSVLATRPNVTSGEFSKEDVKNKKVNLLFFGNFHKMKLEDFEWAIKELMQDKDYLYSSMTKDLYFLGKVLDKKYKILRVTYTVFIIGILVTVMAFAITFKLSH